MATKGVHPWRSVVADEFFEGANNLLSGRHDRTARWYELTLECGHVVERGARYSKRTNRGRRQGRSMLDVLEPPKRVRCNLCPKTAQEA